MSDSNSCDKGHRLDMFAACPICERNIERDRAERAERMVAFAYERYVLRGGGYAPNFEEFAKPFYEKVLKEREAAAAVEEDTPETD